MKTPTVTQFKRLILSVLDFSDYGLEEPNSDQASILLAAEIMRQEVGHMLSQGYSLKATCLHWLQGLPTVCTLPFYNGQIVNWWEQSIGVALKDDDACHDACDMYWQKAANSLAVMITRAEQGYKIGVTI